MRKRMDKLAAALLLLLLLGGCSRSLGERAIVKLVYLDEADGQIQAGLAVFTCAPNSDTASVEGEARIYTAQGASIEEALYHAERQQNKKPFYAQNEILLLGPGTARDVTPYIEHFAGESAARPNLAVFLTPLSLSEFAECEEGIGDVVREGERLMGRTADGTRQTQGVFEIELSGAAGMNGYLPIFSFSKEQKDFCGVRELALIQDGKPYLTVKDTAMQLFLLLAGKADRLTVYTQVEGRTVSFSTQGLCLTHTALLRKGAPDLTVCLSGKLDGVTVNGVPVEGDEKLVVTDGINRHMELLAAALNEQTFTRGNDVFHYGWRMRQYDAAVCDVLARAGLLYETARVAFQSNLRPE